MSHTDRFATMLRDLRGRKSITEIAKDARLSASTLYNAEAGTPVSWRSIEQAYGPLCPDEACRVALLISWALTQTEEPMALYLADQAMKSALMEEAEAISRVQMRVVGDMGRMAPDTQVEFAEFAADYARSPHTRAMARSWLQSIRDSARDVR